MQTIRNQFLRLKLTTTVTMLLCLVFIACTAIRSTRHSSIDTKSGLAYYLPAGRIKLTVVRETITPAKIQSAPGRIERVTNTASTFSGLQPAPAPLQYNPDGTIKLDPQANRTLTNIISETRTVTTDSALAAGEAAAAARRSRENWLIGVDVELAPDRDQRYLLEMKPSAWADDFMKFRITNGLLESIILTNSDQSLNTLNNLALAAIEFAKVAAQASAASADTETSTYTTNTFLFNPFNPAEQAEVTTKLAALNQGLAVSFADFPNVPSPQSTRDNTSGVFYRPLQSYKLSWNSPSGAGVATVYLPNSSPVLTLDVSRAAFVSQSWMLGMAQGIPYEVTLNKPSQVAAVSMFPLNLARSLVSLPTNILQLKFDIASRQNELVKAQNAHITNLLHLLQEPTFGEADIAERLGRFFSFS